MRFSVCGRLLVRGSCIVKVVLGLDYSIRTLDFSVGHFPLSKASLLKIHNVLSILLTLCYTLQATAGQDKTLVSLIVAFQLSDTIATVFVPISMYGCCGVPSASSMICSQSMQDQVGGASLQHVICYFILQVLPRVTIVCRHQITVNRQVPLQLIRIW